MRLMLNVLEIAEPTIITAVLLLFGIYQAINNRYKINQ